MGGELTIKRTAAGRKKGSKAGVADDLSHALLMRLYPPNAPRSLPRVHRLASLVARISASAIRDNLSGLPGALRFAVLYRC